MPMIATDFKGDPSLGLVDIRVDHAAGSLMTTPNDLIMRVLDGTLAKLVPIDGSVSVISGQPAVIYTTDEVSVPLTTQEVSRIMMRSLSPSQYFALKKVVGLIYELAQFYDEENGWALDPKIDNEDLPAEIRSVNFGARR